MLHKNYYGTKVKEIILRKKRSEEKWKWRERRSDEKEGTLSSQCRERKAWKAKVEKGNQFILLALLFSLFILFVSLLHVLHENLPPITLMKVFSPFIKISSYLVVSLVSTTTVQNISIENMIYEKGVFNEDSSCFRTRERERDRERERVKESENERMEIDEVKRWRFLLQRS